MIHRFAPRTVLASALALAAVLAAPAFAATATGTLPVTTTISVACTVGTMVPVAFAAQSTTAVVADSTSGVGSISINCTNTGAWTLSEGQGANYASGNRMRIGTTSTNYLTYSLFSDVGRTNAFPLSGTGTGSAVAVPIYGTLQAQTATAVGNYADSVIMTVTY